MSEFKITGPGRYVTRTGELAIVERKIEDSTNWAWLGISKEYFHAWTESGFIYSKHSPNDYDIIGPWVEPAAEHEKPQPDACPDPNLIYPVKLRDWFAGMALQGLLAHAADRFAKDGNLIACAFSIADEMMAARQKGGAV